MQNQIFQFDQKSLDAQAEQYFGAISGFDRNPAKFQDKMAQALQLREKIRDRITPQLILSCFDRSILDGEQLRPNGRSMRCTALQQLNPAQVTGIYLYVLTVGNVHWDESPTINMLYADIWGTSYVDATRDRLRELVQNHAQEHGAAAVSDSFGPGYYGMPVTEVPTFLQVLDVEKIGVSLFGDALMLPLKSLAGMFIAVDGTASLPGPDCVSCLSQGTSCEFCHIRSKARIAQTQTPDLQNSNRKKVV